MDCCGRAPGLSGDWKFVNDRSDDKIRAIFFAGDHEDVAGSVLKPEIARVGFFTVAYGEDMPTWGICTGICWPKFAS
jgi:hypothetical protein